MKKKAFFVTDNIYHYLFGTINIHSCIAIYCRK